MEASAQEETRGYLHRAAGDNHSPCRHRGTEGRRKGGFCPKQPCSLWEEGATPGNPESMHQEAGCKPAPRRREQALELGCETAGSQGGSRAFTAPDTPDNIHTAWAGVPPPPGATQRTRNSILTFSNPSTQKRTLPLPFHFMGEMC